MTQNKFKPLKQIIALGGGGFSDQPDNLILDEYILEQTTKSKPNILFIPAAGGDHPDYVTKFYAGYQNFSCNPDHIALTREKYSYSKLEKIVMKQDIIFVGGGSPFRLMNVWKECGMDKLLRQAYQIGIIMSGMSAGAVSWFEDGFRNPKGDEYYRINCLGLLEGSFCPHYDAQPNLRKNYRRLVRSKKLQSGYGVQDGVALHFINSELAHVVSSYPEAKAFLVKKSAFRLTEKIIKPKYLGVSEVKSRLIESTNLLEIEKAENGVRKFIDVINRGEANELKSLMTNDHLFIDSLGVMFEGKDIMRAAWEGYFSMVPNYKIEIESIITKDEAVVIFGRAKGTVSSNGRLYRQNSFDIPACWKAIIEDDKIKEWRVYADNTNVHKLIEKVFSESLSKK